MRLIPSVKFGLLAFIVIVGAFGCATPVPHPSELEIAQSDPGLLPVDWEAQIRTYWANKLIDPTSPLFTFDAPKKGYSTKLDNGKTYRFGWHVWHTVNGKNSFGGYTGRQTYIAFFYEGRLRVMYQDFGRGYTIPIDVLP